MPPWVLSCTTIMLSRFKITCLMFLSHARWRACQAPQSLVATAEQHPKFIVKPTIHLPLSFQRTPPAEATPVPNFIAPSAFNLNQPFEGKSQPIRWHCLCLVLHSLNELASLNCKALNLIKLIGFLIRYLNLHINFFKTKLIRLQRTFYNLVITLLWFQFLT